MQHRRHQHMQRILMLGAIAFSAIALSAGVADNYKTTAKQSVWAEEWVKENADFGEGNEPSSSGFRLLTPSQAIAPLRLVSPSSLRRQVERGGLSFDRDRLGWDDQLWKNSSRAGDRHRLLEAIDHSLTYLQTPEAAVDYTEYLLSDAHVNGITRDRVRRSLQRFRQLILTSQSASELQAAVRREFSFYQATGVDGEGTVEFTGYFEPTYAASRVRTSIYRYPLYRAPADLDQWSLPHPTRTELEGIDGLQGDNGPLRGLELVWLRDRLDAFLVQVQGSARLQLTDGSIMSIGYAGRTEYEYRSIGRMLIEDGIVPEAELTLPTLIHHFQQHPEDLNRYLPQNNRFVFFRETHGAPALGSLNVPVTAERSIATDKSLMPPGALAVILTDYPVIVEDHHIEMRPVSRYVLDQDTGGAIRGAGRADIFMGTGALAGDRAGLINTPGELFYLILNENNL